MSADTTTIFVRLSDVVGTDRDKAASDLYSPVSGEILGVNEALTGKPELVNKDAEGAGWIYKIKLAEPSELDTLLDREAYLAYVQQQG